MIWYTAQKVKSGELGENFDISDDDECNGGPGNISQAVLHPSPKNYLKKNKEKSKSISIKPVATFDMKNTINNENFDQIEEY